MTYNYKAEIFRDIVVFLGKCNANQLIDFARVNDLLSDVLWGQNSVTGCNSGSYFSNKEAKEAVIDNLDLVAEVFEELSWQEKLGRFICDQAFDKIDVVIRGHLLDTVISEHKEDISKMIIKPLLNGSIRTPRGIFHVLPDEYRLSLTDEVLWDMGFSTHHTHEGYKIMAGHGIGFAVKEEE